MDLYEKDAETNASELYREVCVQIIEVNGLKADALDKAIKVCDMHIEENKKLDKERDPLFRLTPSFEAIKKVLTDSLDAELPKVPFPPKNKRNF